MTNCEFYSGDNCCVLWGLSCDVIESKRLECQLRIDEVSKNGDKV